MNRRPIAKPPYDWFGFFVQFFFGAIVGAGLGVGALSKTDFVGSPSYTPLICFMAGGALVCGLVAGVMKDEFWRGL